MVVLVQCFSISIGIVLFSYLVAYIMDSPSRKSFLLHVVNPFVSFPTRMILLTLVVFAVAYFRNLWDSEPFWVITIAIYSYLIGKHIDVREKRYSALVILETELLRVMTALSEVLEVVSPLLDKGDPRFVRSVSISLNPESFKDISRIDLKNKAFRVSSDLRTLEHDFELYITLVTRELDELTAFLTSDKAHSLAGFLGVKYERGVRVLEECKRCLSRTRYYMRNDKPRISIGLQPFVDRTQRSERIFAELSQVDKEFPITSPTVELEREGGFDADIDELG